MRRFLGHSDHVRRCTFADSRGEAVLSCGSDGTVGQDIITKTRQDKLTVVEKKKWLPYRRQFSLVLCTESPELVGLLYGLPFSLCAAKFPFSSCHMDFGKICLSQFLVLVPRESRQVFATGGRAGGRAASVSRWVRQGEIRHHFEGRDCETTQFT